MASVSCGGGDGRAGWTCPSRKAEAGIGAGSSLRAGWDQGVGLAHLQAGIIPVGAYLP